MGPTQDPPDRHTNQAPNREPAKKRTRRPRLRRCLLKGCEQKFRPRRPWSRYCGDDCRGKARKWSRWKAQRKYRVARHGKDKRQAQCRRYRAAKPGKKACPGGGKGSREGNHSKNIFDRYCDRPGCYATFARTRHSPLQRFCSTACRRALERVLERERRWRERRKSDLALPCCRRFVHRV